jgi:uncharacterized protein (DUF2267 family)
LAIRNVAAGDAMTHTTIHIFTHAAEQAQQWVNELTEKLGWKDSRRAYRLLKSTLHAVRDWITPEELADLSAQLPLLIRGIFFESWDPAKAPVTYRKRLDFIAYIEKDFHDDPIIFPEVSIGIVLGLLQHKLPGGEVDQVRQSMPKTLRDLWSEIK